MRTLFCEQKITERECAFCVLKNRKMTTFAIDKSKYTPEKWEQIERRQESKDKAEAFFTNLFGQRAAWVILANVMEQGRRTTKNGYLTFDETWRALGYATAVDIIFRAINGLPCATKDTGEKEAFLKARTSA